VITPERIGRRQRVAALSPDERRAALIAATIPLLREHGTQVSTRQIAQAAGVAEGTIFGVFKDKVSLLRAAVLRALDPGPVLGELRAIDPALPLRDRLVRAVRLVREHVADHGAILHVVHGGLFVDDRHGFVEVMAIRHLIVNEVSSLIEPDARLLRRSPLIATRLVMALVAGPPGGHLGVPDQPLADDEIVSIVLDGLLIRPQQTQPRES
jgi:AcrR family transcriptional regulator